TNTDFLNSQTGMRYREAIYINANIKGFRDMLNAPLRNQSESIKEYMRNSFTNNYSFKSLDQAVIVMQNEIKSIEATPEYKAYHENVILGSLLAVGLFGGSLA